MANDPFDTEDKAIDWLVVGLHKEDHAMNELLLSFAEAVHIHGEPSADYLRKIIAGAPNLEMIRVIPDYADMIEWDQEAGKVLAAHHIQVVVGRVGERRGCKGELITASYRNKHYFLLQLDDERKKLLAEVQQYAPEDWEITSRYLCLSGEKHLTLQQLADERGVSTGYITQAVGTVLYHLDSPFDVDLAAVRRAKHLEERIAEGQEVEKQAALRRQKLRSLGLVETDIPKGMSDEFLEQYVVVLKGWRHDGLSEMFVTPRERHVLVRRYGLEDKQFRSLEEVGQLLILTRERIRQIESAALKRLRAFQKKNTAPPS